MSEEKKLKIDRVRNIVVSVLIDAGDEMVERKVKLDNMLFPKIIGFNDYVNEIYNNEDFVIYNNVIIEMNATNCKVIED